MRPGEVHWPPSGHFTPPFPHFVAFAFRGRPGPPKLRSMFQADPRIKPLNVIRGGKERSQELKGASTMNTLLEYKFVEFKSESSVASGVTVLVSAWFLVAAAAILSDPVSPYTQRAVVQEAPAPSAATTLA